MDTTELRRLGTKRKRLMEDLDGISERIRELATEALREGVPPSEVIALSGYSHSQVRNMARVAGLPPAPPGAPGRPRNRRSN